MITVHASEVLAVSLIAILGVMHYMVYMRRMALVARIRQLESLNAALGLRLMRLADIMKSARTEERERDLDELKASIIAIFRQYQAGSLVIEAGGDVSISGDVTGRDKR